MSRLLIVTVAFAASLLAQRTIDGRAFVPLDPKSEIWVDLRAMRDTGVWDGVARSVAGTFLPMIEQNLGFRLAELDRLRAYPPSGSPALAEQRNDSGVVIFEGSDKVLAPAGAPDTRTEKIGGHEVVVIESYWAKDDPDCWVAPKPGVVVYAPRHVIEPVLLGTQQPGVTPPELLSLVAGRGVLAHAVITFDDTARAGLVQMLDAGAAASGPDFLMVRMRIEAAADAADDPIIHLDGKLRWATAENGPPQMLLHLRTRLEDLKKHPRYGALKKLWNLIELGLDGRDLTLHVDLGRPRDAGALLALAAPMLMLTATASAAVPAQELQVVEIEDVTVPPDPPATPPPAPQPQPSPQPGNGGRGGGR